MNAAETLEHFRRRTEAMTALVEEIVEIESPSYDAAASARVAAWIESEFTAVGATVERIAADGVGEHVLARLLPGDGAATLLLGHTDTVHPIGAKEKNPTRIENGKLFGCGVFDMKANIVIALEVLRYFNENGMRPSGPVTMLLSCDEEVGSFTGREHVEREARAAERCYVLEPSAAGRVKTGRKGTGMFTLNAKGVPAHAGLEPEKGASAILELSRQIEKLHGLNAPHLGTTVNVCTVSGGTTSNVIPEHAECSVDVRFTTQSEADRIDSSIRGLTPFDERVTLTVSGGVNRPPMERTEAVADLFERARAAAASFGYELEETQVGGASDGNFVGAIGVPLLDGLGVSGDGAHTLGEYINIDDMANRATLLALLLKEN